MEKEMNSGLIPIGKEDYFVKKIIDLAQDYKKLEKDQPYVKIPFTTNEWDLIIKKLKREKQLEDNFQLLLKYTGRDVVSAIQHIKFLESDEKIIRKIKAYVRMLQDDDPENEKPDEILNFIKEIIDDNYTVFKAFDGDITSKEYRKHMNERRNS